MCLLHVSIIRNGGNGTFRAQKTALKNWWNLQVLLFSYDFRPKIRSKCPVNPIEMLNNNSGKTSSSFCWIKHVSL